MFKHPHSDFLKFVGTPFERYILPVIPAGADISQDSSLVAEQLGKIPGSWSTKQRVWYGYRGWSRLKTTKFHLEKFQGWQEPDQANTAIALSLRTGDLVAADIDINDEKLADEVEAWVRKIWGEPLCVRRREGSARRVLVYFHQPRTMPITKGRFEFTCPQTGAEINALDILGMGQQVVIEGPHAKGAMHYWLDGIGLVDACEQAEDGSWKLKAEHKDHTGVTPKQSTQLTMSLAKWVNDQTEEGWKVHISKSGAGGWREAGLDAEDIDSPASSHRIDPEEFPLLAQAMRAINLDDPLIDYDRFVALNRALCAATGCDMTFFYEQVWPWVCTQEVARGNGPRTEDRGADWLEEKWRTFGKSAIGADYVYRCAATFGFVNPNPKEVLDDEQLAELWGAPKPSEDGAGPGDNTAGVGANTPPVSPPPSSGPPIFRVDPKTSDAPRPARRTIQVDGEYLATAVEVVELAMVEQGVSLFSRGDRIVRPGAAQIHITNGRDIEGERLYQVEAPELREHMTQCARFVRWSSTTRQWLPTNAPDDVAKAYLARTGRWRLRPLSGIITAPTLRADGSLLDQPGYDVVTGLLYRPDPTLTLLPLSVAPTKAEAAFALAVLKALISTFPFVSDVDRSVALSAILTTVVRRTLPRAPLHAFTAPTAGMGKGKLVDIAAVIATGREASVEVQGRSEEETEKRIVSLLLTGDPVLLLDNCTLPVEGDFLCSLLTSEFVKPRILGSHNAPLVPTNAAIFATGNNLVIDSDMVRRSLVSEIDAMVEHPELRRFDSDPVEEAKRNRGLYLGAALTLMQAFALAGRPRQSEPLGSFEAWNHIRDALLWLGEADPVACQRELKKESPEHGNRSVRAPD